MSRAKKDADQEVAEAAPAAGAAVKVGSQAAYDRYLPAAQDLPAAEVTTMREDPTLCYQNVSEGVQAVFKREAEVKQLPLALPLADLRDLPELALALGFAADQVNRRSPGIIKALRSEAARLRGLLLAAAEMLMHSGDLSARDIEQIKRGKGPQDAAKDCVALSALFLANEGTRSKTSVKAEDVTRAGEVGTQLLSLLRPAGARQPSQGEAQAVPDVEIRDRLWSLLWKRHRELRRVGMWLYLDEVNEHVPPLRSRTRPAPTKAPTKPPADSAKPTDE